MKVEVWINERRNIHNAATEGPWSVVDEQELVGAKDGWPEYLLEGVAEGCEGFVRDRRDATAIVDAHNTLPNLLTAVEKVLELHRPEAFEDEYSLQSGFMCESCYDPDKNEWIEWPCETVRTIEGAIK